MFFFFFLAPFLSKGVQVSRNGILPSASLHIPPALTAVGIVTELKLLIFSLPASFGLAGDSQTPAEISRP